MTVDVAIIQKATEQLQRIENGLRDVQQFEPVPNAIDAICAELVALYLAADDTTRAEMRRIGRFEQTRILVLFGDRMAVAAVRSADIALARTGLVAIVLEDFRWDPRESLLRMTVLWHSASRLGADARAIFLEVAAFASEDGAKRLLAFADAPSSLATMGFTEGETEHGFVYVRDW